MLESLNTMGFNGVFQWSPKIIFSTSSHDMGLNYWKPNPAGAQAATSIDTGDASDGLPAEQLRAKPRAQVGLAECCPICIMIMYLYEY